MSQLYVCIEISNASIISNSSIISIVSIISNVLMISNVSMMAVGGQQPVVLNVVSDVSIYQVSKLYVSKISNVSITSDVSMMVVCRWWSLARSSAYGLAHGRQTPWLIVDTNASLHGYTNSSCVWHSNAYGLP